MTKKLEIVVLGRVQGIGYRAYTLKIAQRLRIRGYVKNQADGSVKVLAIGDEDQTNEFIGYLKKGPAFSLVREMSVNEVEAAVERYQDFRVEY
jgi:acylphosphatase